MIAAAQELICAVKSSEVLDSAFRDGKMLGALICRRQKPYTGFHNVQDKDTQLSDNQVNIERQYRKDELGCPTHEESLSEKIILYAYSGKKLPDEGELTFPDGKMCAFVPPVYDITQGHFHEKEAEISGINAKIAQLEHTLNELTDNKSGIHDTIAQLQCKNECNNNGQDSNDSKNDDVQSIRDEIKKQKARRAEESIELQKWTFKQYKVLNGLGEASDIETIFAASGLTPPAATGDCAAPKLLQYAYSHDLEPLEIGEFWYGKSPEGPVREQGRFYPACSWKCGPLLKYMTMGLETDEAASTKTANEINCSQDSSCQHSDGIQHTAGTHDSIVGKDTAKSLIVYEDEHIIVANKPSSTPSVPGLDGRKSLLEIIQELYPQRTVFEVHRLDQDTSGLIVYAFSRKAQSALRKQFENREVSKRYIAVLDGVPKVMSAVESLNDGDSTSNCNDGVPKVLSAVESLNDGDSANNSNGNSDDGTGIISLPLAPDYEDKPRQKVSFQQGKEAITEYSFHSNTIVEFTPHTGRTHQLRVHAAHFKGLGCPIAGDTLYGSGSAAPRLCLHASYLAFTHPADGRKMEFCSTPDFINVHYI